MRTKVMVAVGLVGCVLGMGWYVAAQVSPTQSLPPTFRPGDVLRAADLNAIVAAVQAVDERWEERNADIFHLDGNVGIGIIPGEKLHLFGGNFLMHDSTERELRMVHTGLANSPRFKLGRMVIAGDGSPEFRVLYEDDRTPERSIFEFDNKGIVASVKPSIGSHFEGFIVGEEQPLFRLNSFPTINTFANYEKLKEGCER